METIKIKDVIFSFRHMYLENLKKLNKRLKRHISIDSSLINDITLYLRSDKYCNDKINVKYNIKEGSLGSLVLDISEALYIDSFLKNAPDIVKDSDGKYTVNSKGISLKDSKIDREMECILKEDFYKNITTTFANKDMNVSFNGYEITFSTSEYIICYNCVGDLIYTYSSKPMDINDILNRSVDVEFNDDFHSSLTKKVSKAVEPVIREYEEEYPGDYFIKENNNKYVLKKIKKGKLYRYV